jgi:hypothetical protein
MSTRSNIGKINKDGNVEYVYCNSDSYLEGVGATLKYYYPNLTMVNKILSRGGLSVLSNTVENSIFYHRDKGEKKADNAKSVTSFDNFIASRLQEYNYILKNKKWYYVKYGQTELIEL